MKLYNMSTADLIGTKEPDSDAATDEREAMRAAYGHLLEAARAMRSAGRQLDRAYGHIGELYGAAKLGIRLSGPTSPGSGGRLGDDHVDIRTITPRNARQAVRVRLDRSFDRLLIVRIGGDLEVEGRLIDRRDLPARGQKSVTVHWKNLPPGRAT